MDINTSRRKAIATHIFFSVVVEYSDSHITHTIVN